MPPKTSLRLRLDHGDVKQLRNFMNYKFIVFSSTFLICFLLAVVVNIFCKINIAYIHLFYISIILTGI